MRFVFLLGVSLLCFVAGANAQWKTIVPQKPPTANDALGSPGIDDGDYVYVSGQGPRRADGSTVPGFAGQVRQSLENVRTVVEAAGLTMDNVVYVQVYLEDTNQSGALDQAFTDYFPNIPPARGILGVARLPEPPVLITAVAVRDLKGKQPVAVPNLKPNKAYSAGMLTHDRLFISTMPGSDPTNGKVPNDPAAQVDFALDRLRMVAETAGLTLGNMVFVNPYLTPDVPMRVMNERYASRFEFGNTPARATIEATSLPDGAHIAYTGVAVRDLNRRRAIRPKNMPPSPTASPCVFAGETLYCSAKSGFIPGANGGVFAATTADQVRQTMRNLLDNLEEADMKFDDVVSTTIYLDDLSESGAFGKVYRKYFKGALPAQTIVQQIHSVERNPDDEGHYPTLEQVSLIAVRSLPKH